MGWIFADKIILDGETVHKENQNILMRATLLPTATINYRTPREDEIARIDKKSTEKIFGIR